MAIPLPYTFVQGTIADANQVNANFSALSNGSVTTAGGSTMNGPLTLQTTTTMGSSGAGDYLQMFSCRGSVSSPTAVQNGDTLGGLYAGAYDGSSWSNGGEIAINYMSDGNWTPTSHPTFLNIGLTSVNNTNPDSILTLRPVSDISAGQTAMWLVIKDTSGAVHFQQVVLGAPNSGGSGLRLLAVAAT